ncbi:MAG: GtrA family protein [Erysipelotrichia bacterium]|nr:GtrA family protein [Erysipelotrichia bacterium]
MLKKQVIRFIAVGIVNTVFGNSIYALLIFLGLAYFYAVLLSTILGVLFNFKTIGKIVFKSNDHSLIFRFVAVYIVIYLLNIFFLWLFQHFGFENMYINGLLLLVPLAVVSFVLNKIFVFKG